jgi:hypothetical protein
MPTKITVYAPDDIKSIKISFDYEGEHNDYKVAMDFASFIIGGVKEQLKCLPDRISKEGLSGADLDAAKKGLFNWKGEYIIAIDSYTGTCTGTAPGKPQLITATVSRWAAKSVSDDLGPRTHEYKFGCMTNDGFKSELSDAVTIAPVENKRYPLVTITSGSCTESRFVVYKGDVDVTYTLRNTDGSIYTGKQSSFWDVPADLVVTKVTPDAYV